MAPSEPIRTESDSPAARSVGTMGVTFSRRVCVVWAVSLLVVAIAAFVPLEAGALESGHARFYDPASTVTTSLANVAPATGIDTLTPSLFFEGTSGGFRSFSATEGAGSLAGRDALGRFTGAGGYGAQAEAQGLSNYELATGQAVIRDQVRASLSGGGPGRFYDGLVRNADGTYTGIEVKSGTASLTAPQRAFDSAVNGGEVARATLNGQPIDITSTELVRVR